MTVPLPPVWAASPPEVHSALLSAGPTDAGIVAAASSWSALGTQYAAAATQLTQIVAQVNAAYQGPSAEAFTAAHAPMIAWLTETAVKAELAATAHSSIAAAHVTSVATMPTLVELAGNHATDAALQSTNFFGVNSGAIASTEADYTRMWGQAAAVMEGYDSATTAAVDAIPPTTTPPIIVIPGVGEAGSAAATTASFGTQTFSQAGGAALAGADGQSTIMLAGETAAAPAYAGDGASPAPAAAENRSPTDGASRLDASADQGLDQFVGQVGQIAQTAPSAAQSALGALGGGGPGQILNQAPQMLAQSAPQLGQLISGIASPGDTTAAATPVGFAGTSAINGLKPIGVTRLAGGALSTGGSGALLPSSWTATPTPITTSESAATAKPVSSSGGVSASGRGGAPVMMGGAARRSNTRSSRVSSYSNTEEGDGTEDAGGDEQAAMD